MRIRLTADYRGVLTGERFYQAGEYEAGDEMPPAHAAALVEAGRAELLEADPVGPPQPTRVSKGRRAKGGL